MRIETYKTYLRKIRSFARLCQVEIEFVPKYDEGGEYNPDKRKVVIDNRLTRAEKISTLLHEFGHFMDDSSTNRFSNRHHFYGYDKLEKEIKQMTHNQKLYVWESELAAWQNAQALAKMIKIPLGKWFFRDQTSSLNSYRGIKIKE